MKLLELRQPGRRSPYSINAALPLVLVASSLAAIRLLNLSETHSVLLLLFAVVLSAWLGGTYAGITSLCVSLIAVDYFLREPKHTVTLSFDYLQTSSIFILVAAGMLYLLHKLRKANQELRHQALHDPLTGLPNRRLFYERLEKALKTSERRGKKPAVLYADLDNFGSYNNRYGHLVGDAVLKETATRLVESIRAGDTASRFGGDEFVILLPELDDYCRAETVAEKIAAALSRPVRLPGHELEVSASIGIAMHPSDGNTMDELVRNANIALRKAKQSGKRRFQSFSRLSS